MHEQNDEPMRTIALTLALLMVSATGVIQAQDAKPDPSDGNKVGRYIKSSEVSAGLAQDTRPLVAGRTFEIVPGMVIRRRVAGPNNASVHTADGDQQDVTEVYYVVDGGATIIIGGTMIDPTRRTDGIKGGETHELTPGDIVVLPAGTAHWFSSINGHITYIEARYPTALMSVRR